jgi:hypothetical protein
MRHDVGSASRIARLFLVTQVSLVHCLAPSLHAWSQTANAPAETAQRAPPREPVAPNIAYGSDRLPAAVEDMRETILSAVRAGDIDALRHAYELNELKPDLGSGPVADPVAHWRQISGDGAGREILAVLGGILDAGYVTLALGRDAENPMVYVWPYFAEVPLGTLTPGQEVELLRLVPPEAVKQMKAAGRYTYWRLAIGADGTWHYFRKQP